MVEPAFRGQIVCLDRTPEQPPLILYLTSFAGGLICIELLRQRRKGIVRTDGGPEQLDILNVDLSYDTSCSRLAMTSRRCFFAARCSQRGLAFQVVARLSATLILPHYRSGGHG